MKSADGVGAREAAGDEADDGHALVVGRLDGLLEPDCGQGVAQDGLGPLGQQRGDGAGDGAGVTLDVDDGHLPVDVLLQCVHALEADGDGGGGVVERDEADLAALLDLGQVDAPVLGSSSRGGRSVDVVRGAVRAGVAAAEVAGGEQGGADAGGRDRSDALEEASSRGLLDVGHGVTRPSEQVRPSPKRRMRSWRARSRAGPERTALRSRRTGSGRRPLRG